MKIQQMKIHEIEIHEIQIQIIRKPVKNLRLSVHPPDGRVRVSAPLFMSYKKITGFVESRISWIRQHQERIRNRARETELVYAHGQTHFFQGQPVLLNVEKTTGSHSLIVQGDEFCHQSENGNPADPPNSASLQVRVRNPQNPEQVQRALEKFFRMHLTEQVQKLIARYEPILGVRVKDLGIKKMRTRWGTCNYRTGKIWISLEMAKKSPRCLEYLVVHEMVHLLEPSHNARFKALLDRYFPGWREVQKELNGGDPNGSLEWVRKVD